MKELAGVSKNNAFSKKQIPILSYLFEIKKFILIQTQYIFLQCPRGDTGIIAFILDA